MRPFLLASVLSIVSLPALADVVVDTDTEETDGDDADDGDDDGCSTVPGGDLAAGLMVLSSLAVGRRFRR